MIKYILEKIDNLPPLPQTIIEIEEFRKKTEKDTDELLEIIEKDALIVSTLLKISNSAIFGFRSKVETPKKVINLLGVNFTIFIVINETMQNILKTDLEPYQITSDEFREATNLSSILANSWLSKIDNQLKEEILLPALLQEAGRFIIAELLVEKNKCMDFRKLLEEGKEIAEIEKQLLQINTSKVTAEIFKHWKLSDKLIDIIEYVDDLNNSKEEYKKQAQILNILKTACNPNELLTEKSIEKAINKTVKYHLDKKLFVESVLPVRNKLRNNN